MAVSCEKGQPGKPVEVKHILDKSNKDKNKDKNSEKQERPAHSSINITDRDYESVSDMERRRQAERRKLIEQMLRDEEAA